MPCDKKIQCGDNHAFVATFVATLVFTLDTADLETRLIKLRLVNSAYDQRDVGSNLTTLPHGNGVYCLFMRLRLSRYDK